MSFGQEKDAKFDDKHFEVLFFNTCSFFFYSSSSTCTTSFFVQGLKKVLPLIITTLYYHSCKGTRMSTCETNKYKSYYLYVTKN